MKLDDLKQDWEKTITTQSTSENLPEVIAMLEKETSKIDKEIKRRDIIEISIAIALMPFWIYGLLNSAGFMYSLGCWLAIASCIFIPYKLMNAKKFTTDKSDNIKAFLMNEQQKVSQQKALLESIVWWYITPLTSSILLITLGSTVDDTGMPHITGQLAIYYGFLVLLVVGVYFLNKRAAKKKFAPLLEKIELRLADLTT